MRSPHLMLLAGLSACAPKFQHCEDDTLAFVEAGYTRAEQLLAEQGILQSFVQRLLPSDADLGTTQSELHEQLQASGAECVHRDDPRLEAESTLAQWDSDRQNVLFNMDHAAWQTDQATYQIAQAVELPERLDRLAQSWADYDNHAPEHCEQPNFEQGFLPLYEGQKAEDDLGTLWIHEVGHQLLGAHSDEAVYELNNGRGELDIVNTWHHAANLLAYEQRQSAFEEFSYVPDCWFEISDADRSFYDRLQALDDEASQ